MSSKVWIIGASGYSGAELCRILSCHPHCTLEAAFVSSSENAKPFTALYPQYQSCQNLTLQVWQDAYIKDAYAIDVVFLALPHEVSHRLAPLLLQQGCCVIDLSGAFRLKDMHNYPLHYGFEHQNPELVHACHYALPEFSPATSWQAQLLSMPGCYPTAATLALRPLIQNQLFDPTQTPVISAVSGVSGAGRKASLKTSFCEVSLQPYGILNHRHQCEIEQNLGCDVLFIPHLGNFKRGIIATCTARLAAGVSTAQVNSAFCAAYEDSPAVRICSEPPKIDDVAGTPRCDLHITVQGRYVVVIAAIDNLLKGAASQAVQAFNIKFKHSTMAGLL